MSRCRSATRRSRASSISDGFGRLLQTRAQAEDTLFGDPIFGGGVLPADQSAPPGDASAAAPAAALGPNVVVSGWQVYDNKGRVVEKYEPFFSDRLGLCRADRRRSSGRRSTMFYDPRGQAVRTLNPDGSEQRVVYGVPGTIAAPT